MNVKQKLNNLKLAYSKRATWLATIIAAVFIGGFFYYFSNFELVSGNLGRIHAVIVLASQYLITILFGLNVGLLTNKLITVSAVNQGTYGTATLGSIFGILVVGCPACSIGLASILGLSAFLVALPFFGLEFNILAVALLIYSTNSLLKVGNTCKV